MNQEDIMQFEKHWQMFLTKVYAQIKKRSQKGTPSCPQLNAILSDCALDWDCAETGCGRWLMNLEKASPEKAGLIRQVLLEDMRFSENQGKKGVSGAVKAAVPVAGAIAGLAISRFAGAGIAVQMISAVAPAAILMPTVNAIDHQISESNTGKSIQACLAQLELYRTSILGILQN